MKSAFGTLAIILTAVAHAQLPIPAPAPGMNPYSRPTGPANGNYQSSSASSTRSTISTLPTETVRLLSLASVEQDLSMTSEEYSSLAQIAPTMTAATTSEDDAFVAVSRVLTTTQSARLQELLVQDLGYGSLALSGVRTALKLSDVQTTQVVALVTTFESAKRAILNVGSTATASVKAVNQVASNTNSALEKLLTSAQDTALHTLAGKSLGTAESTSQGS